MFQANNGHRWRMILVCGALALGILSSAACSLNSPGAGSANPLQPVSAAISVCDSSQPVCAPATSFRIAQLRTMLVSVQWNNLTPGTHSQTVNLILPGGGLYQSAQTGFIVTGEPFGSATTQKSFPIAGTWITRRSLTGPWTIQALADGQPITSQEIQFQP